MKKLPFLLGFLLPVAALAADLGVGDGLRKVILDNVRRNFSVPDVKFVVKRIAADGTLAYFCGTGVDAKGNGIKTADGMTPVYDVILERTAPGVWATVGDYGLPVETAAAVGCVFDDDVELTEQTLRDALANVPN